MPSIVELEQAMDERIAIGNLTELVSDRVPDPISYIGELATVVAQLGEQDA